MHLKLSENDVDKSNSDDSTDEHLKENMVWRPLHEYISQIIFNLMPCLHWIMVGKEDLSFAF